MKITNIQHFSVDDGPGIRTTVFASGCNLHCNWCHNPEAMIGRPRIMFDREKCIHCLACVSVCPNRVHRMARHMEHEMERSLCTGCFLCAEECPSGALKPNSREYSPEELMQEILQDRFFYRGDGSGDRGGVTFSGGEPLLQGEQLYELVRMCCEEKIHTAIDTAANLPLDRIEPLLKYVNLLLIDCKAYSEELHIKGTGVSNRQILGNIAALAESHIPVWVRVPVIPGFNDSAEEMGRIAGFLEGLKIERAELLPYHKMGVSKYGMLGLPYVMQGTEPSDAGHMKRLLDIFLAKKIKAYAHIL